jgi:hypothetical protein
MKKDRITLVLQKCSFLLNYNVVNLLNSCTKLNICTLRTLPSPIQKTNPLKPKTIHPNMPLNQLKYTSPKLK